MPASKSRGFVDKATGAVVRVETTKEAKRRFQKTGGAQWKPTRGQINAAEIWNKQEEKLRKDREREDRKKRNAVRQAEKDARQKECQQEMLDKGRITIEDTWGKVNASQNRLHRFFRHQQRPSVPHSGDKTATEGESNSKVVVDNKGIGSDCHSAIDLSQRKQSPSPTISRTRSLRQQKDPAPEYIHDQSTIQTSASPTLQSTINRKRKRSSSSEHENSGVPQRVKVCQLEMNHACGGSHRVSASPTGMPPPPRPHSVTKSSGDSRQNDLVHSGLSRSTARDRLPLTEMTASDLNIRANEKPDPEHEENNTMCSASEDDTLVPSQIIRQTLCGLSSQDFLDEIDEVDKENSSPSLLKHRQESNLRSVQDKSSPFRNMKSISPDGGWQHKLIKVSTENLLMQDANTEDEFIDFELDDESLLSMAATQQLKSDLLLTCIGSGHYQEQLSANVEKECHLDGKTQPVSHSKLLRNQVAESFGLSGVDDQDMLECVQTFEMPPDALTDAELASLMNRFEENSDDGAGSVPHKRRNLPWNSNPVAVFEDDDMVNSSQKTELIEE